MDDLVYRLSETAKRRVFSPLDPLSLAEILRECCSDVALEMFWARIGAGQHPVIPRGIDSEIRIAVERLVVDPDFRRQVMLALADLIAREELGQEVRRWKQKKRRK